MACHVKFLNYRNVCFLVLFFSGLFLFPVSTIFAQNGDSFYVVKGIIVHVPQGNDPAKNSSAIGLLEAQKIAFKLLLEKMLSARERKDRHLFIKEVQRNIKDLLSRSIIVSERRTTRDLELTVTIHFDEKKIREVFSTAGVSICQTSYPSTLLLFEERSIAAPYYKSLTQAFERAGHQYGIEMVQPLRDVEDLATLALSENPAHFNEFNRWASGRYKTVKTWKISVEEEDGSESRKGENGPWIRLKVVEIGDDEVTYYFTRFTEPKNDEKNSVKGKKWNEKILLLAQRIIDPWIVSHIMEPGDNDHIDISVINSNNLDTLDELIERMKSLSGVDSVSFLEMSSTDVKLRLEYQGSEAEVKKGLEALGASDQGEGLDMIINLP
ncbi:MAG: DUF2066 domain-containing protein [Magnetococcales bacterium]|nr:DUF2066 domain-containing protein [Magnetococcales bacterium]